MIKKIGLPLVALTAMLAFGAPKQADAAVRFGVSIGAPVYAGPARYVPYGYPAYNPYYAAPAYVAPAPVYVGPSVGIGFGGGHGYGYSRPVTVNRGYGGAFRGRTGFRGRR
jgi:hypothetical protein